MEHNIAQGIMTADVEGALATTNEVVSMLIQVRAASARLRTGGTEEGDSQPVTQGYRKLRACQCQAQIGMGTACSQAWV